MQLVPFLACRILRSSTVTCSCVQRLAQEDFKNENSLQEQQNIQFDFMTYYCTVINNIHGFQ